MSPADRPQQQRKTAQTQKERPSQPLAAKQNAAHQAQSQLQAKIDQQQRHIAQLETQKANLQGIINASPAITYTTQATPPYTCTYVSQNVEVVLGYSPAEFQAEPDFWQQHLHPEDAPRVFAELSEFFEQGKLCHEYRVRHRDGHYVWIRDELNLFRDAQGVPQKVVGYFTDISDRQASELKIHYQSEQEILVRDITQRIRESLDLHLVLDTAAEEIRQFLKADRVGIFQLFPEKNYNDGQFIAESVIEDYSSAIAVPVHDHCFGDNFANLYAEGRYYAVADIESSDLSPCHREILRQFQVRANLVIPLVEGKNTLWGLLCIHQCGQPRTWKASEIALAQQIANQLAIAISQANLYEQLQTELFVRQRAEANILQKLEQQHALAKLLETVRDSLAVDDILRTVTHQVKALLQCDRVIIFRLYPDGRSQIVEEAVAPELTTLKDMEWDDEVWSDDILELYWQGRPRIVPDVMQDRWTDCLIEYSQVGQIQSKIVAPILQESHATENHRWVTPKVNNKLWGIMVAHACHEKRVWQEAEAELLQQITNSVAIAIQQANLFGQLQAELGERQQTERQLAERNHQLLLSNEELARATRLKDEFLANMSHELRTPLNAILGMTEGLQEQIFGPINERQLKALRTTERTANHLLTLINDILDVAKIESGQAALEFSYVAIEPLCLSTLAFIKQQAVKKGIRLKTDIQPDLPPLFSDETRIRQVLLNLLSNAVKFTEKDGTVTLEVTQVPRSPQPLDPSSVACLRITITDTGIGIAPENIDKLFRPFVQIDGALNRKQTGTGLGLTLVKQIVELHGGQVGFTSELGVGSCFTVDLPYTLTSLSPPPEPTPIALADAPLPMPDNQLPAQGPLLLLAEDNPDNIEAIADYLEAKGYRLLYATNGKEAIDQTLAHQPDVILMDIQMPDMDGIEAIGHIRQQPNLSQIPIIALTALAMPGDRERCLAAGANDYLSKPVRLRQLDATIKALLGKPLE